MRSFLFLIWFILFDLLVVAQNLPIVSSLQLWLHSDSVELQGIDTVSKLYDCSGNGYDAEQLIPNSQPRYNVSEPILPKQMVTIEVT